MPDIYPTARGRRTDELSQLADYHIQHDLSSDDRDALKKATKTVSVWTTVGSAIGIGLGLYTAFRLRSSRKAFFDVFRAAEKPVKVLFADGRSEAIPDITPLLKPTTLGDFATYFFASAGGLFLGGELGFLGGAGSASKSLTADPERKKRVENAFRSFRADMLRREADALEKGKPVTEEMF
ncbi:hypothetical protein BDV19DRAFT_370623 [Aspergillus venezuelensis]